MVYLFSNNFKMDGLNYITDENGLRTALVIDINEYGKYIEDIEDILIAFKRKDEKRISLSQVKEKLVKYGKGDV